ncbi:hypothetical protein [Pseudohaliea sp.]|uniref:hypothetical protein n=1 Tax=Pseudohaliea sp. TaxID=2740289 RepID=UPI0032F01DE1
MRDVESHDQIVDGEQAGAGQQPEASRRAFALKAAMGAAAVATLANRPAWGQDPEVLQCVSATTWASFNMGDFSSLTGGVRTAQDLQARADGDDSLEIIDIDNQACLVRQPPQDPEPLALQQSGIGKKPKKEKKKDWKD